MRVVRRFGLLAGMCVVLVVTVLAGCNLLQYQFCVTNLTPYDLKEVNITTQSADSWGSNDLTGVIEPGGSEDIKGFSPGMYMVRGVFDIAGEPNLCHEVINGELIIVNEGLEITTTNICIDYREIEGIVSKDKADVCTSIYGAARFEI
ncbi:MAG: hypothetical protein K1Y02_10595 [Candidatus Hydrogenedentes bacterium]|nr:hypothetical protein [Candidatus Hydrogenedentota bacterium]